MLLRRLSSAAGRAKGSPTPDELAQLLDAVGPLASAGIAVNSANALRQATVYTCVKVISEAVASLPVRLHRRVRPRVVEDIDDHPALDVMRRPNEWMTWHELCQFWVTHSELRGNGYAFKARSGDGRVRELLPLLADQVSVLQQPDWALTYTVGSGKTGINGAYGPDRVFHLRNFGTLGYKGLSTIGLMRDEIGLALQMGRHSGNLYKNGTNVGTVFKHPNKLSEEAYKRLKESIDKQFSGSGNTGRPFIAEEGMTVEKLGMTMEDAQFLESRRFTKQEIAGAFGVPMFLLNDTEKNTTWGSGLEQISRAFLNFSLGPRLSRVCDTLGRELLLPKEQKDHFFAFDTSEFTMGDFVARMNGYKTAIASHVMTPNEARHRENMNPYDGGDDFPEDLKPGPDVPPIDPTGPTSGQE